MDMGTTSQGREPQKSNPDTDATASGGTDTPGAPAGDVSATVELVGTGGGRFEGPVVDGSFTVLSLSGDLFDRLREPETVTVLIEAAE